ncbi:MAG: hypothetical protein A2X46_04480 [Lentisphaerae bacterium GWF2_57_35]|nr:MAG: hypothetical protein A2X46_04480 [Lentisphaerae bacterium GWF2_57_35]
MDDIVFFCSQCNAKLTADVDEAGEDFECPKCQSPQTVPVLAESGEKAKRVTTKLKTFVQPPPSTSTGAPVVRIPKRTIVMSSKSSGEQGDESDDYLEDLGGGGMRLFAVALGTVGFALCFLSLSWAVFSLQDQSTSGWIVLLMFTSTFLSGLMGLVLAQLARFMVRIADRLERFELS